jgi:hypothetical protein
MAAPEIIPAGSLTFGAHVSGPNQFLLANGLANGPPQVSANGNGSEATVPVRSWVYAVAWNFERNTIHQFRLIRNSGRGTESKFLSFPNQSGVRQYPGPHLISDILEPGDTLQIASNTISAVHFPGPITVTLYLAELL